MIPVQHQYKASVLSLIPMLFHIKANAFSLMPMLFTMKHKLLETPKCPDLDLDENVRKLSHTNKIA